MLTNDANVRPAVFTIGRGQNIAVLHKEVKLSFTISPRQIFFAGCRVVDTARALEELLLHVRPPVPDRFFCQGIRKLAPAAVGVFLLHLLVKLLALVDPAPVFEVFFPESVNMFVRAVAQFLSDRRVQQSLGLLRALMRRRGYCPRGAAEGGLDAGVGGGLSEFGDQVEDGFPYLDVGGVAYNEVGEMEEGFHVGVVGTDPSI